MRTIIVGNSSFLLDHNYGRYIDSFDEVVRLTAFRIKGFEQHVGTKVTTWVTDKKCLIRADYNYQPSLVINRFLKQPEIVQKWVKRQLPNAKYIEMPTKEIRSKIRNSFKSVIKPKAITTGIATAYYYIFYLKKFVTLIGFEGYQRVPLHYWRKNKEKLLRTRKENGQGLESSRIRGKQQLQLLQILHDNHYINWIRL